MPQRNLPSKFRLPSQTVREGGCPCGAIRYKVTGPALDRGSCHCRSCRKASSAPELPYAQFALSHFEITRGWLARYHSSAEVTRSFCSHCGSPITYRHVGRPDRLDIMTCSLDDPNALPPAYHVWTSHKPCWAVIRRSSSRVRDHATETLTGEGCSAKAFVCPAALCSVRPFAAAQAQRAGPIAVACPPRTTEVS